jgi:hypothetical protein
VRAGALGGAPVRRPRSTARRRVRGSSGGMAGCKHAAREGVNGAISPLGWSFSAASHCQYLWVSWVSGRFGPLDAAAVFEAGAEADEGDEVGCGDRESLRSAGSCRRIPRPRQRLPPGDRSLSDRRGSHVTSCSGWFRCGAPRALPSGSPDGRRYATQSGPRLRQGGSALWSRASGRPGRVRWTTHPSDGRCRSECRTRVAACSRRPPSSVVHATNR